MKNKRIIAKLTLYTKLTEEQKNDVVEWLIANADFIKNNSEKLASKFIAQLFDNVKKEGGKMTIKEIKEGQEQETLKKGGETNG